jgi:hypothetical protein
MIFPSGDVQAKKLQYYFPMVKLSLATRSLAPAFRSAGFRKSSALLGSSRIDKSIIERHMPVFFNTLTLLSMKIK